MGNNTKYYIVISIKEFSDIPIICRKGSTDAKEGALYIRSKRGRPKSSEVSTSAEMRDVIERSIFKTREKFASYGAFSEAEKDVLDDELGGL